MTATRKLCGVKLDMALSDAQLSCRKLWTWYIRMLSLSTRYFDGAGNLTDAQIRRKAEEMNVQKIRDGLRREFLTMGDSHCAIMS